MAHESVFDQIEAYAAEKPFRDALFEAGRELREQDAKIKRLREINADLLSVLKEITFRASLAPEDEWIEEKALAAIDEAEPS